MSETRGKYPWEPTTEEERIKQRIFEQFDDAKDWWEKAAKLAGYDSIREYQDDIFHKYSDIDAPVHVRPSRKMFRVLGWIAREIERGFPRGESESDIQVLVLFAMIILDSDKHRLDWKKAADDLGVREIVDKYIMRKKEDAHE